MYDSNFLSYTSTPSCVWWHLALHSFASSFREISSTHIYIYIYVYINFFAFRLVRSLNYLPSSTWPITWNLILFAKFQVISNLFNGIRFTFWKRNTYFLLNWPEFDFTDNVTLSWETIQHSFGFKTNVNP